MAGNGLPCDPQELSQGRDDAEAADEVRSLF
jgi:hypothetical protein